MPRPLLILQIDGLSLPALRLAMSRGRMPAVRALVEAGTHRLHGWCCALPSQTSATQAGLLFGDGLAIPAFRWFEKDRARLMVSNHPADAAEIEARARRESGLLAGGGSSVGNLLSGSAPLSTLTMSTLDDGTRRSEANALLTSPRFWLREIGLMAGDIRREIGEGLRQRVRNVRPRVGRGGSFPFLRAVATVLLRDLAARVVAADLRAGVSPVYADFVGYDEVAHHAGPATDDALHVLEGLDRVVGRLLTLARRRGYDVVLLSDHGQSGGAPFRQRSGETLEQLVARLAGEDVSRGPGTTEAWGYVNRVLSELAGLEHAVARLWRLLLRSRLADGYVETGPDRRSERGEPGDVVVCASGNLGLVYLTKLEGRADLAAIRASYPRLVDGLVEHPAIDFVVACDGGRPVVLGPGGRRWLDSGETEGTDALARFERACEHAADHLRDLASLPHSGDLIVNGGFDPRDGSVAAFEELAGSHGGLGGPQLEPFLLAPAAWDVPATLEGPAAVNALLRSRIDPPR